MTIIDQYFDYQEKFEKKYGEKTIVLMEVGSFFEIYGIINDKMNRGKIDEISDITNLSVSKKCDKYAPVSMKNPLMAGFPNYTFEKWKDILIKSGYTIIKIEQDSHGTSNPNRKVTDIISPGININTHNFSNNVMSVYLEEIKDSKFDKFYVQLGISTIDITTGESTVYENYSPTDDYTFGFDEVFRFIQTFTPQEIIIHAVNLSKSKEEIISYLELDNFVVQFNIYDKKHFLKNKFKLKMLEKIFPNTGMLNPIEFIDMERMHFALNSFIYLIQFVYEHNENILEKLNKPKIWENTKYLILSHDSINQLNITPNKNYIIQNKKNSLWEILDKTTNSLGKRELKKNLLNPILDCNKLNERYNIVEILQNENQKEKRYHYEILQKKLTNISDIERLHRRMAVKLINPSEFINLDLSYDSVIKAIQYLKNINNKTINDILPKINDENEFKNFIKDYRNKLNMEEIQGTNLNNIQKNIFREGLFTDIDSIQKKIDSIHIFYNKIVSNITKLIIDKKTKKNNKNSPVILKNNEKEGYYISMTNNRLKLFLDKLEKENLDIDLGEEKISIQKKDLEIKKLKGYCKIYTKRMKEKSFKLEILHNKINKLCLEKFSNLVQKFYTEYRIPLKNIVKFISNLDFLCCVAKVSKENGYCKPKIDNSCENSYINCENLRHPIIEKINTNVQYTPNNVNLGKEEKGILLFGVNAVGKSSYMKSVGISIIMAQSGFYVSAKSFTYKPYKYLFTRISNNDNIFKGQSSFAVEMDELRGILKRTNKNSLVLGDELCCGTETTSGLAIVAAGVIRLSESKTSFIFATHLHRLSKMNEINEIKTVKKYHMKTFFDKKNNELIYNRKLTKGSGDSIYGLEVAKAMGLDKKFIDTAIKIRKNLEGIKPDLVSNKTSKYNSDIVIDKCYICDKPTEEVHHIKEQELANKDNIIEYFHKNNLFNLVQLCYDCHQKVHHGNLYIKGYTNTSNGVKLDFEYKKKNHSKKRKYSKDQVDIIRDLFSKTNNYSQTKKKLNNNYGWNISNITIKKIINNLY